VLCRDVNKLLVPSDIGIIVCVGSEGSADGRVPCGDGWDQWQGWPICNAPVHGSRRPIG
jgi:hypothetical protein